MVASKTEICNMAISHLGISQEIADLDTEASMEAEACRRFYDNTLEQVLREFPWPFATEFVELALVEENPTQEWGFSYQKPADALELRRVLSGLRTDNRQSRIPYREVQDAQGKLIYTDQINACLEYTKKETEATRYPPDFVDALSLKLSMNIIPRLSKGDPFKMGDRNKVLYEEAISKAWAKSANEQQPDQEPFSEFDRFREGSSIRTDRGQEFQDLFGP